MNTNKILAIILIVGGVAAFAYQGITYTSADKPIDIGPIHVTTESTKTLPLPPIVGGLALAGGIILLIVDAKKA